MSILVLSFFTAFTLTYFAIPPIISIARSKRLYDEPVERSSHKELTPSLGGIGIFAGMIFSIILWTPFSDFGNLQYILCALLLIFLIGAKDDISPVSPSKKVVGQLIAASILVFKSKILLNGMYGLFWIEGDLPYFLAAGISMFTILVITNAFNLIDGIDGLAGSIGTLIAITLGCWFFVVGAIEYATLSFAMAGATLAFLRYNFTPAKIFMGDTGSLTIGLVSAVLIIQFIDLNDALPNDHAYYFEASPAVAIAILIVPLFDTMRVFVTRIIRGHYPFHADRRHIHHLLIDYGFTHMQATAVLIGINLFFISLVFALHKTVGLHWLLSLVIALAATGTLWLHRKVVQQKRLGSDSLSQHSS